MKKLSNKQGLDKDDISSVCRTLCDSVEVHTIHPHPYSLKFALTQLFRKYPSLILDPSNESSTFVSIYNFIRKSHKYLNAWSYFNRIFSTGKLKKFLKIDDENLEHSFQIKVAVLWKLSMIVDQLQTEVRSKKKS